MCLLELFLNSDGPVGFFSQRTAQTEMHSAMTGSYTKQFPNNIEPPKGKNLIMF